MLTVEHARSALPFAAPAVFSQISIFGVDALHDGNELHKLSAQLIAEVLVHFAGMVFVRMVNGAQDIAAHTGFLQVSPPSNHHRVCAAATLIQSVGIVQRLRPVNRHTNQDVVLGQELRPVAVDQSGVGLNRVDNALRGAAVILAQLDGTSEKVESAQGGLATLPQHRHLAVSAGGQELCDVSLQRVLAHALARHVVEQFLRQEEAVLTVEVARRTSGFGNDGERKSFACQRCPVEGRGLGAHMWKRQWCQCRHGVCCGFGIRRWR